MNRHSASIPPEGRHRYALRVYYEDTDAGGIVYHANYLRFAERARTEALRDLGVPHADLVRQCNLMFVVRRAEVDYLRAARVDDSLVVETEVLVAGAASATLRQTVRGASGVCAVLVVRLACVRVPAGLAVMAGAAGNGLPVTDRAVTRTGPADVGLADAGPGDAGRVDAGRADAGRADAGPGDAGPGDAGPGDAGPGDAGPGDAGPGDAGLVDVGSAGTAAGGNKPGRLPPRWRKVLQAMRDARPAQTATGGTGDGAAPGGAA